MASVYNEEQKSTQYWIHKFKNGFAREITYIYKTQITNKMCIDLGVGKLFTNLHEYLLHLFSLIPK